MTIATILYDTARKFLLDGTIDLDTDTLKLALLTSGYNPQPSAPAWVAATVYSAGMIVVSGGRYYEAIVGGTSSGAPPILPTIVGATLVDNTVTWYCWGYAPPSTHSVFADVSANELVGTGYTAGGEALTGKAVAQILRSAYFTADPVVWTGAQFSARYAVLYKVGTANGHVDPMIAYMLLDDQNVDVTIPVVAAFSIAWSPTGIFMFS